MLIRGFKNFFFQFLRFQKFGEFFQNFKKITILEYQKKLMKKN